MIPLWERLEARHVILVLGYVWDFELVNSRQGRLSNVFFSVLFLFHFSLH